MRFKLIMLASTFLFVSGCVSVQDKQNQDSSIVIAEEWLGYLDSRDTDGMWSLTSDITKNRIAEEFKIRYWIGVRNPLGNILKREFQYNWKLEQYAGNIPDGMHRKIVYWSRFENKDTARETLIITKQGDQWRIIEWYVN